MDSLRDLSAAWERRGVVNEVRESRDGAIHLDAIVVPTGQRGRGLGTEYLMDLTSWADRNRKTLALTPSRDFGATSVARLQRFYARFGFIRNRGSRADLSISAAMIRRPRGSDVGSARARSGLTGAAASRRR